jgi:hypothetical protein
MNKKIKTSLVILFTVILWIPVMTEIRADKTFAADDAITIDDLIVSTQAAKEAIFSGKITYKCHDDITPARPNLELGSNSDDLDAEYLKSPITYENLCTLQFKRNGEQILWRLKRVNTKELSNIDSEIIRRYGLNYNITMVFDGQNYYCSSKSLGMEHYFLIGGQDRPPFGDRPELEELGIPYIFTNYYESLYDDRFLYEQRIIEATDSTIKAGLYFKDTVYPSDYMLVQSDTISRDYDGRCIEKTNYQKFTETNPDTGQMHFYTKPSSHTTYSDYQQISGVWYPMKVHKVTYDREYIQNLPQDVEPTEILTEYKLDIINCELNIPLDDSTFTLAPEPGMYVIDYRFGTEYKAE